MGLNWDAFFAETRRQQELPLDGLRAITAVRAALDALERRLAADARSTGSTWAEIGEALGISRQSAWARHRPPVRSTDGDSPRLRG